jgi:hypothetical protein
MKVHKNKGVIVTISNAGSVSNSSAQNSSRGVDSGRFIGFANYAIMMPATVNFLKSTILIGLRHRVYILALNMESICWDFQEDSKLY